MKCAVYWYRERRRDHSGYVIATTSNPQLGWIPDGVAGTRVTLQLMRSLARKGSEDPIVIATAQSIVRSSGVSLRSTAALRVLFEWVRDSITYKKDPAGIEYLSSPRRTLDARAEDCDGKATLLVALIRALKHPAALSFKAIGADRRAPSSYSHVYAIARLAGVTIPLDCTYRGTAFGWEYPAATARMEVAA